MKELEEETYVYVCACVCMCVCVCVRERERERNFAANLVKILQRHFNCLTKHMGRTVVDGERVSVTQKAQISRSKIKVVLVVFFEFLPHGQMVNKQLY
jgi:hypothetical protein